MSNKPPENPIELEREIRQALVRRESMAVGEALGVQDILAQVRLIQNVMKEVMQEGEHYGTIPGCGDKKTLLQPGAQKLTMTFRLAPSYEIQETDLPKGHKEYRVICTLKSIQSGTFVGQGVGACSTMESKYRYRGGARKCPKCGKETIIMGKKFKPSDPDPGWLCWVKKGGCGATWPKGATEIESQSLEKVENENPADCYNCVTPETKVLTHDLQWVPAGEIESGDVLIGVEENASNEYARHFSIGEAVVHGRKLDDLYEIAFEDGRVVRCNGEHKWLVKKIGLKGTEWMTTADIHEDMTEEGKGRPRHWTVMSVCKPWTEDTSKEAGYIAGLLDGDGSLGSTQLCVFFAQQANTVLALLKRGLTDRGYKLGMSAVRTENVLANSLSQKQVHSVRVLGGFAEQLRLLGSIRPPRLLERWLNLWDLSKRRLEGRGSGAGSPVRIREIKPFGEGEIVILGTSCKTYIAEGLVCHNTCLKMAKKRAFIDATITATAASDIFTQDIGDDESAVEEPAVQQTAKTYVLKPRPSATPEPPFVSNGPEDDGDLGPQKPLAQTRFATNAYRERMLMQLFARPSDPARQIVSEFFVKAGVILETEAVEDIPLRYVPVNTEQMQALRKSVAAFEAGEPAKMPYDANPEPEPAGGAIRRTTNPVAQPELPKAGAKPGVVQKPASGQPARSDPEWWRDVIVPVPHKGEKRDDYMKHSDTIGSLYDARHDDEEARKRLFGFVNHYEPKGWEKRDGTQMPPSEVDLKFRDALDAFAEYFEHNHPDERL